MYCRDAYHVVPLNSNQLLRTVHRMVGEGPDIYYMA